MHDTLTLYFRLIGASVRGQMEYRASFWMMTVGHFLTTVIEFLGVWALFARFRSLQGWSLPEVALFYGTVHAAFALAEGIGRGFDVFGNLVKSGDFDRYLLRPHGTAFQVAAQELQLMRVGRLAQALIVLFWAAGALHVAWTLPKALLLLATVLGGACLFYGLFVLQATMAFWTVESLEIMNALTYGGTETGQFPLTIYRGWFRTVFIILVPLAFVGHFPLHAILDRPDPLGSTPLVQWLAPLVGPVFLLLSFQVWRLGERRYRSTGS